MVQLDQTYYVGAQKHSQAPHSLQDLRISDIACLVVLFASWIGVFLRYGFGTQAVSYVLVFTLLMAATLFDRLVGKVPLPLSIAIALVWLVSLWFMPYGIGPIATSAGAGGLVSVFSNLIGMGHVPMLLDGLIGGLAMGAGAFAGMIIRTMFTNKEFRLPDVFFLTALGLFLGTTGSVLCAALALCVYLVVSVVRHFASSYNNDPLASHTVYSSGGGSVSGQRHTLALAFTLATYIMFLFL